MFVDTNSPQVRAHGYAVFQTSRGPQLRAVDEIGRFAGDAEAKLQYRADLAAGDVYAQLCARKLNAEA